MIFSDVISHTTTYKTKNKEFLFYFSKTFSRNSLLFFCSGHNMVKDVTVVDTNYTEYAVVLKYKNFDREYTQVALYGETQRDNLIWKFCFFRLLCWVNVAHLHLLEQVAHREPKYKSCRSLRPLLCPVVSPEHLFWPLLQQVIID